MPVTPADVALVVFTACNTARVFAYLPQILKISRDTGGAAVISYTTWTLFGISHLSTVAYAVLVVDDWRMAGIFMANTLCCASIVGLTAWKRAGFQAAQRGFGGPKLLQRRAGFSGPAIPSAGRRQS